MRHNDSGDLEEYKELVNLMNSVVSSKQRRKSNRITEIISDPVDVIGKQGAIDRDKLYTNLLKRFSDNYEVTKEQTKRQKTAFFVVILVLLTGLLVSGIVLLFLALNNCSPCNIAIVVGASVDIISSFIAIPTIIAKHLFPEKIDNDVIKIVQLLVENDKDVRETVERHNKK